MMTQEQRKAAIMVINAMLETIKEAGEQGVPLGPMYAAMMSHGMSYDSFMQVISTLERIGKIKVSNNCAYGVK